jgi:hypothetical protein
MIKSWSLTCKMISFMNPMLEYYFCSNFYWLSLSSIPDCCIKWEMGSRTLLVLDLGDLTICDHLAPGILLLLLWSFSTVTTAVIFFYCHCCCCVFDWLGYCGDLTAAVSKLWPLLYLVLYFVSLTRTCYLHLPNSSCDLRTSS